MALNEAEAIAKADEMHKQQQGERTELDVLRLYVTGRQRLPAVIPTDAPNEVKEMARVARVNICDIVVQSLTQSLFVDGFIAPGTDDQGDAQDVEVPVWQAWMANRMNKHQAGLHRACFTYGTSYTVVTPGDPMPVIRAVSPRLLTTAYGADPDWPVYGFERRPNAGDWRLYDDELVYTLRRVSDRWELVESAPHGCVIGGVPRTPVVRYRDLEDLDLDDDADSETLGGPGLGQKTRVVAGQVAPLMALQDQMNLTSFSLKAAEWYSAFRQRWVVGWVPGDRTAKMAAGASQLWTFDEAPTDMQLGEFNETTLDGFLKSRDATARFAATLSQTPVHELVGELVNLSAEALAAAEAGRDRSVDERKTGLGESHEQTFEATAAMMGETIPDNSQILWRDTSARAFAAIVDGLGKLAAQLEIPPEELWDRIPGVKQQDVRRWKRAAANRDIVKGLNDMLGGEGGSGGEPARTGADSGASA